MPQSRHKVSLVTDLNDILDELMPQPVLMVRPKFSRTSGNQQVKTLVEVVDLANLNLAHMKTFEAL